MKSSDYGKVAPRKRQSVAAASGLPFSFALAIGILAAAFAIVAARLPRQPATARDSPRRRRQRFEERQILRGVG